MNNRNKIFLPAFLLLSKWTSRVTSLTLSLQHQEVTDKTNWRLETNSVQTAIHMVTPVLIFREDQEAILAKVRHPLRYLCFHICFPLGLTQIISKLFMRSPCAWGHRDKSESVFHNLIPQGLLAALSQSLLLSLSLCLSLPGCVCVSVCLCSSLCLCLFLPFLDLMGVGEWWAQCWGLAGPTPVIAPGC